MAEAEAQTATATSDTKTNGVEQPSVNSTDPASNTNSDEKAAEAKEAKASNSELDGDDENSYERYDNDRTEQRGRKDDRGGRRNDRGRGGGRGGRGRGRGRGGGGGRGGGYQNNRKRNVRTEFERKEESSDATEIRRQVEFYFSDSNLPIDKFLLEETGGPENKPLPLKTIHNFKRMRHFQPFSTVVEAVKGSDFLVVNDKDEVSRKNPLDKKFTLDVQKNTELLTSESMLRSIYAKGFGQEKDSTAFDIEEFFQPYGVRGVRLRRYQDGTFKGSVFVEFDDEDAAKQFLDMDEKPKFNDNELQIMSKQAYVDMKNQDILDGKVVPKSPQHRQSHAGNRRGGNRGGGNRGDRGNRNGDHKRKRDRNQDNDDDDIEKDNWRERRDRFQQKRQHNPSDETTDETNAKEDTESKAGEGDKVEGEKTSPDVTAEA